MNTKLSPVWIVTLVLAVLGAGVIFAVLNQAFGGPTPLGDGAGYRVSATFGDAQGLVKKSLVLVRGVRVGEVADTQRRGNRAQVTLAIDTDQTQLYRDATVRAGRRTLFGEPYVQLDPGHSGAGQLPSGSTLAPRAVLPSVELDEALEALDRPTRARLRSLARTGARIDADRRARDELNDTFDGLSASAVELRTLTSTLIGQRADLTRFVSSGRVVLDTLATRDARLRRLVTSSRVTTEALAGTDGELSRGLAEAAGLQRSAQQALAAVDPLARRSGPTLERIAAAAPQLTRALEQMRPAASSAASFVRTLPALRAAAVPTLAQLRVVSGLAGPLLRQLEPALRNVVPVVGHLAPYKREVLGFITGGLSVRELLPDGTTRYETSQTVKDFKPFEALGENGAPYGWARFFVGSSPGATAGQKEGIGQNPYTQPGKPFEAFTGRYRRLLPAPLPAKP